MDQAAAGAAPLPQEPASEDYRCWSCRMRISQTDNFCRHCGSGQGKHIPWHYKHSGIILLTLLGLGPFGLILVWRSPALDRRAKWVYTALIAIGSCYFGLKFYQAWLTARNLFQQAVYLG